MKLRQVPSLEDLSIKAYESVFECAYKELTEIDELCQQDASDGFRLLKIKVAYLGRTMFEYLPNLFMDRMVDCIMNVLPKLFDEIEDKYGEVSTQGVFNPHYKADNYTLRLKTLIVFCSILLQFRLESLDLSRFPNAIKYFLLKDIEQLSNLKVLKHNAEALLPKIPRAVEFVLRGVTCMPHLVHLDLLHDCNDAIVKCLSKNCKQLQILRISHSDFVTEACVPYLAQMKKLRDISLTCTNIRAQGYTTLLCLLPMLENIGTCLFFNEILENLDKEAKNLNRVVLNLRKLTCFKLNEKSLKLLLEYCPHVVDLELHYIKTEITPLHQLQNLKALTLHNGNVDSIKLLLYLENYHDLESLTLKAVFTVDVSCLMSISDRCPLLKTLHLEGNDYYKETHEAPPSRAHKYFLQLEKFSCDNSFDIKHLEIILSDCLNIKSIQLGSRIMFTSILSLMSENHMTELKEFIVPNAELLSLYDACFLINHLSSLSEIRGFYTWKRLSCQDLLKIEDCINSKNPEVKLRTASDDLIIEKINTLTILIEPLTLYRQPFKG